MHHMKISTCENNLAGNECKGHKPSSEDLKNAKQMMAKKFIVEYYMALE